MLSSALQWWLTQIRATQVYKPATPDTWGAYDSVKRWTKGIDVFEKEYIVVPINES